MGLIYSAKPPRLFSLARFSSVLSSPCNTPLSAAQPGFADVWGDNFNDYIFYTRFQEATYIYLIYLDFPKEAQKSTWNPKKLYSKPNGILDINRYQCFFLSWKVFLEIWKCISINLYSGTASKNQMFCEKLVSV